MTVNNAFEKMMLDQHPGVKEGSTLWALMQKAFEAGRKDLAMEVAIGSSNPQLVGLCMLRLKNGKLYGGAHSSATPKLYRKSSAKASSTYHEGSVVVPVAVILGEPLDGKSAK